MEADEEERIREENILRFLQSQRPWILLPPTFPQSSVGRIALFHPDTNTSKIVDCFRAVEYYFEDEGLNLYMSEEQYDELHPVVDFFVDSPEDMNAQHWKRYFFIWPNPGLPWNIDARPRKRLSKPPSEAISEVISESPEI